MSPSRASLAPEGTLLLGCKHRALEELARGCVGRQKEPFQLSLPVASPGKSWSASQGSGVFPGAERCWTVCRRSWGVSALLLSILPLAAGRGCSELPSPFSRSWLSHLQKESSKGKVPASEGSPGAQALGKAGGKLENFHGNYTTRHEFIASS